MSRNKQRSRDISSPKVPRSADQPRLTRSDVAKLFGESVATIRRREGNSLHPTVGPDGIYRFDPAEVVRALAERPARPLDESKEGERDARVFDMLSDGRGLRDIVTTLRLPADLVARLMMQWSQAGRGDVVIPAACKAALEHCVGLFADAAALTELVHALEAERERVESKYEAQRTRMCDVLIAIGTLAAANGVIANALPELKQALDEEQCEMLDRVVAFATTKFRGEADVSPTS